MKKYTSWGQYVTVETTTNTYENVIICPYKEDSHIIEASNGDTQIIPTNELVSLQREGHEKYIIQ